MKTRVLLSILGMRLMTTIQQVAGVRVESERKEFQPLVVVRRCSGFRRHVREVRRGASISFLRCGCWGVKTVSITNVRCGYQVWMMIVAGVLSLLDCARSSLTVPLNRTSAED